MRVRSFCNSFGFCLISTIFLGLFDIHPAWAKRDLVFSVSLDTFKTDVYPAKARIAIELFLRHISDKLKVKIRCRIESNSEVILNGLRDGGIDGALLHPIDYLRAVDKMGLRLKLIAKSFRGGVSYEQAGIWAIKGRGIGSLKDLKGKRLAISSLNRQGFDMQYVIYELKRSGISLQPEDFFSDFVECGSSTSCLLAVIFKEADALVIEYNTIKKMQKRSARYRRFIPITASPKSPGAVIVLTDRIDEELVKRIKNSVLTIHTTREGRSLLRTFNVQRLIEVRDEDFGELREFLRYLSDIK